MKILVIHNLHRKGSASGDDKVFKDETALLEKFGNTVLRYTVTNDSFDEANIIKKLFLSFGMFWSISNYNEIKKIIKKSHPDIVHVHTFFPLLSPSVLYAAKSSGCKVVATLHDTRFICPNATSLRNGEICNKCLDGKYLRMCKYKCFKDSAMQSLIVAIIFKLHRILGSYYNKIDRYICLNDVQIKLLKQAGFREDKITKKYNFIDEKNIEVNNSFNLPSKYVVYYGRIGKEKGIMQLMKMWDNLYDIPLVVMGSGPEEDIFKKWSQKKENVIFLGYTPNEKCLSIVKNAQFVMFPSIWYEGCSMVEIEAESLSKPIVCTDIGFSSEAIVNGNNGMKVKLGDIDQFIKVIRELWDSPSKCKEMGNNARLDYEKKYMPTDNYHQLMQIYKSTLRR